MKFVVNTKKMVSALLVGGSLADKKNPLPPLANTKIAVNDGTIVVSSCDGESWVAKRMEVVEADGNFAFLTIPTDLLSLLKTIVDEEVTFVIDQEGGEYRVEHLRGVFRLPFTDANDFPVLKNDNSLLGVKVNGEILFKFLSEARGFTATDKIRLALTGVFFAYKDGEFSVAASDTHKLYADSEKLSDIEGEWSGILPLKAISTLLAANFRTDIKITFKDGSVEFRDADTKVTCVTIQGTFPRYKGIIPTTYNTKMEMNRETLIGALQRCLLTASDKPILKVDVLDNSVVNILAENIGFHKIAKENIHCDSIEGEGVKIGASGDKFFDCASIIQSDIIEIRFIDERKPIVFIEKGREETKRSLLMPLIVN